MAAYWIGRAKMRDLEGYKRYGEIVRKLATVHPVEAVARSGAYKVLEGPDHFDRHVILKFPSMDAALAYYNDPAYQEAAAIRRAASDGCELVITEGL
jgi:uncharacterized protein (DUF1330 family)